MTEQEALVEAGRMAGSMKTKKGCWKLYAEYRKDGKYRPVIKLESISIHVSLSDQEGSFFVLINGADPWEIRYFNTPEEALQGFIRDLQGYIDVYNFLLVKILVEIG